jgi:tRNA uridine 5-carboxymethylaminomethyl modification enzyme
MESFLSHYDVIVVGGGHAGSEAALASSRMGQHTLLITSSKEAIARMPCNPSIGGLAKSHLVYEIDALGGEMGINADKTALQSKTLNLSRGPAVWATRTQCAKAEYAQRMQSVILNQENLSVLEDSVIDLCIEKKNGIEKIDESSTKDSFNHHSDSDKAPTDTIDNYCTGVVTHDHGVISSTTVIITAGTSLRGRIWIGKEYKESGGDHRPAVNQLSVALEKIGFSLIRLKTGTPPRLTAESCDFTKCTRQDGENPRPLFHVEHFNTDNSEKQNIIKIDNCSNNQNNHIFLSNNHLFSHTKIKNHQFHSTGGFYH